MRMRFVTGLIAMVMVVLLAVACGGGSTPTAVPSPTSAAQPEPTPTQGLEPWQVEWEEVKAKAREEGELVVTGGNAAVRWRPMFEAFGQEFGVKVKSSGGRSSEVINRVLVERQNGLYTVDHFISGTGSNLRLIENGVLAPIMENLILPDAKDPSKWFGGKLWFADPSKTYTLVVSADAGVTTFNAWYNTKLVSEQEIAAMDSVWDFLDAKFTGKIISFDIDESDVSTPTIMVGHPDLGPDWFRRLYSKELNLRFYSDAQVMVNQLLQGGAAICLCSRGTETLEELQKQGAPVAPIKAHDQWKDRGILEPSGGGSNINIVNRAAHPNAAKAFLNWFLTKEGQTAMHKFPDDTPPQTLRVDVTEVGVTDPTKWRRPGADYLLIDLADNYEEITAESVALNTQLRAEYRARQ